ncbi:MAG: hypothetical protein J6W84_01230 [Bacteroidales bacterium]|nr:hypothetical protein [Bacteroidales bacterium]
MNIIESFNEGLRNDKLFKVVGVGSYGCGFVEKLCKTDGEKFDFAVVSDDESALEKITVGEKLFITENATDFSARLNHIVCMPLYMLIVVAASDDDYSVGVATELCKQFRSRNMESNYSLSLVITPNLSELGEGSAKADKAIAKMGEYATRVLAVDNNKTSGFSDLPANNNFSHTDHSVYSVFCAVTKIFMDCEYCCIEYPEVAISIMRSGKAVNYTVAACDDNRVENAVAAIIKAIKLSENIQDGIDTIIMHSRFSPQYPLTLSELTTINDEISQSFGKNMNFITNASKDDTICGNALFVTAIVIFCKNRNA